MKKFNKTLAIALAVGVSLGGFQVPVAGAVAGYKGGFFIPDFTSALEQHPNLYELPQNEMNAILAQYPKANEENLPVWGYTGGYYADIRIPEGTADGFSGRSSSGLTALEANNGYGSLQDLLLLKNRFFNNDRDLSTDSKKVLYVAYSIVQDIVKNNGLSKEVKNKLAAAGYSGDFGKNRISNDDPSDYMVFHETPVQKSDLLLGKDGKYRESVTPVTPADAVAESAAYVAGMAIAADTNYAEATSSNGLTPATIDDIQEAFLLQDGGVIYLTGSSDLGIAIINLARAVTEKDLANADLKFRFEASVGDTNELSESNEGAYYPLFFDITNPINPRLSKTLRCPLTISTLLT
ncbi:hypothetical protein [Corynebacterium sp. HMSC078H07]|uniref:hypothetical protein n=1 Tax=Corynebacterium sp. HMSC078H07 TaxID=1739379 RepID=UPI0008A4BDC6|nr:hypothetical protein [Corynebacterium sp. HMSC078H07]OFR62921.1 hypothetical protein HMPREF2875_03040 [Corynebacterium sp. HMSC078H07]